MKTDDVQKNLVRIAWLADKRNIVEELRPVRVNAEQDWIKTSQIRKSRVTTEAGLILAEPLRAREGGRGQNAVGLRTNSDCRNRSGGDNVTIEEVARLLDAVPREDWRHHRLHPVTKRCGPQRDVHRTLSQLVRGASVMDVRE